MKVYGIDIIRGSVRSRSRRPLYALVKMEGDEIVSESEVTGFRLLRILNGEKPSILAVDSLQEIAVDQHDLYAFLQSLPPSVRLVQVTGGERKESLGKVASRFNISFNRFDPFDEARTIARVASLGAGSEVIAFENTSEVVVSRHRSLGKGGWSQNRYVRKIHGAVQQKAREIEMELVAAAVKYEKKETKAFGGSSRVAFEVHAPRDQLPVSSYRGADVQVRITGKKLERIRFRPLSGKPCYLIVGIDPGTTTAIAVLDLDGNLLHLTSSRQMSMSDVIEFLYKIGKPLIIASDVHDMPFSVEKIRRAFNGVAYSPKQDMSVGVKLELSSPYSYQNDHERDALAAAREAFRSYKNKFQNLVKRVPPGYDLDEVRSGIVRGQSLEHVLAEMKEKTLPAEEKAPEMEIDEKKDERVRILDGKVKRLRGLVVELQEDIKVRDHETIRLKTRLKKIRSKNEQKLKKDAEIVKRDVIIQNLKKMLRKEERRAKNLKKRLERIRKYEEVPPEAGILPMKILPSLTREGIKNLQEEMGIKEGDLLYVHRIDGWGRGVVKELADIGVRGLVVSYRRDSEPDPALISIFMEVNVPLVQSSSIKAEIKGKIASVEKEKIENALEEWEEGQEEYEREKKARMFEHIYREYRAERGKEMKKVE
ncbi:MAG TPA: DUF460 domain-containing protein [Methanoregulaceae archaeon]|nr:DUF460 domain-containing protein [Methanoregulaceae archaeon]